MNCPKCHSYVSGNICKNCNEVLIEKRKPVIKKISIKSLDGKLWKIFSEFIRRRDALKFSGGEIAKCCTCSIRSRCRLKASPYVNVGPKIEVLVKEN